MTDDRDENPDSLMLRCAECSQFVPARDGVDGLVPASGAGGGRCPDCGANEFEQVVIDSERD